MARVLLMTDSSEAFSRRLLRGISQYAHAEHEAWSLSRIPISLKEKIGLKGIAAHAKSIHTDAIIGQFDKREDIDIFTKKGIIVIAQDYGIRFEGTPNISANHHDGGAIVATYFIRRGFDSFAFFGPADTVFSEERKAGFEEAIRKERPDASVLSLMTRKSALWGCDMDELCQWLESLPKPVAIMACDDIWAYYITEACDRLRADNAEGRFNIPEDIAVVGVNNDDTICGLSNPNLSSLDQDIERCGYRVAMMINEMMHTPEEVVHDILIAPAGIVTRQSSDIFVNDDANITAVLKFIHENIGQKLSVNDIVAQVPLSRRLLEKKFRSRMNTSIAEYVRKVRVDNMASLLEKGKTVSEAAFDLGYSDIKNISRIFKRIKGVAPSDYCKK